MRSSQRRSRFTVIPVHPPRRTSRSSKSSQRPSHASTTRGCVGCVGCRHGGIFVVNVARRVGRLAFVALERNKTEHAVPAALSTAPAKCYEDARSTHLPKILERRGCAGQLVTRRERRLRADDTGGRRCSTACHRETSTPCSCQFMVQRAFPRPLRLFSRNRSHGCDRVDRTSAVVRTAGSHLRPNIWT